MSLPFLFSGRSPSVRTLSLAVVLLTLSATERCAAAEVTFGGPRPKQRPEFLPLHNYSLQLPGNWTVQPQEDRSVGRDLAAHGPPGVSLSAFVVSTVLSPEENMEKMITGNLEKSLNISCLKRVR